MVIPPLPAYAQTFQKTYGDKSSSEGYCIEKTTDGGYAILGKKNDDMFFVKTDANGDTLWTKIYGGPGEEYGKSLVETSDGGYLLAGNTTGSFYKDGIFIIHTDANGNILWEKVYAGSDANSVIETKDHGYAIAAGDTLGMCLLKIDADGNVQFKKIFLGSGSDIGRSIKQSSDNGYILLGTTYLFGTSSGTLANMFLVKTDSVGDTLWTKVYGDNHELSWTDACSVEITDDGGYIISGATTGFTVVGTSVLVIKIDSIGNILWNKVFNDLVGSGNCLKKDGSDYVIAATNGLSSNNANILLLKINGAGDTLWSRSYGSSGTGKNSFGNYVSIANDGGYAILGATNSFSDSVDIYNTYIVKTDSLGESKCNTYPGYLISIKNPFVTVTKPSTKAVSSPCTAIDVISTVGSGCAVKDICFTESINETEAKELLPTVVYPNPATDYIVVENTGKNLFYLYDLSGKLVLQKQVDQKEKIDLSLPNGIYFYSIGRYKGKIVILN